MQIKLSGQLKNYRQDFLLAICCGDFKTAELLLKSGINPNNIEDGEGFKPLHLAIQQNNHKLVYLLLKHGASLESRSNTGLTPLHVAARFGNIELVKFLLEKGANIQSRTNKRETPVKLALKNDQSKVATFIIEEQLKLLCHNS